MAIKDWPNKERPREKLLASDAASLSDAELLAIFLRTGVRGVSAVDLARLLLTEFGSLRALLEAEHDAFFSIMVWAQPSLCSYRRCWKWADGIWNQHWCGVMRLPTPARPNVICNGSYAIIHMKYLPACFWIPATG